MDDDGFALLLEVLRILDKNRVGAQTALELINNYSPDMSQEQKAKLLENFVRILRGIDFEQKLSEFERKEQMREFKGPKYF